MLGCRDGKSINGHHIQINRLNIKGLSQYSIQHLPQGIFPRPGKRGRFKLGQHYIRSDPRSGDHKWWGQSKSRPESPLVTEVSPSSRSDKSVIVFLAPSHSHIDRPMTIVTTFVWVSTKISITFESCYFIVNKIENEIIRKREKEKKRLS